MELLWTSFVFGLKFVPARIIQRQSSPAFRCYRIPTFGDERIYRFTSTHPMKTMGAFSTIVYKRLYL